MRRETTDIARVFKQLGLEQGTDFERLVWSETAKIPCGQTRSYEQIAKAVGRTGSARAVGQALKRNPLPLVIPCHRVIKKNGDIGGFALGRKLKKILLKIEGKEL